MVGSGAPGPALFRGNVNRSERVSEAKAKVPRLPSGWRGAELGVTAGTEGALNPLQRQGPQHHCPAPLLLLFLIQEFIKLT